MTDRKDLERRQRERGPDRRSQPRVTPERRSEQYRPSSPAGPKEQRGGLQREPDLEGAEKDTGHEVD